MLTFPMPANEKERLEELFHYQILDTPVEDEFENTVKIVSKTFSVPIAAITFLDAEKQYVKAHTGLETCDIPRGTAVCNYVLLQDNILEVEDLTEDDRFKNFPYVTGYPNYRFYAGVPLVTKKGYNIGVLCIIDNKARKFDKDDQNTMTAFARNIVNQLEIRLQNIELHHRNDVQKRISATLSHDILTPLANVKMMLGMQKENSEEAGAAGTIAMNKMLMKGVDNTMDILNNMIQWGKLQLSGDCSATSFSLRQVADDALNEVYEINAAKFNTLVNAVPGDIMVTAEYEGIRFILRNLLTNAAKFTQNGCINIVYDKTNGKDMLMVRDSGIGMSPETTAKLNRSQKITHTNGTSNEAGHGLGLSLVQEYLAKQNKELYFQSMMGVGTIVSFAV